MKNIYVNPFYLINPLKKGNEKNKTNKIFGPSTVVTTEKWPKEGELFYHHVISFTVDELNLPFNTEVKALSFFKSPMNQEKTKNGMFKIIVVGKDDYIPDIAVYPEGYKPWWTERPDKSKFSDGISFSLEKQDNIPQHIVEEGLMSDEEFYPIPADYEEVECFESYIGGFPLWVQGNETPSQKNGTLSHFFMKLSGFDQWFQTSLINGYDLFVFLTGEGEIQYVGQS